MSAEKTEAERLLTWLPRAMAGIRQARWEVAKALAELAETGAYREAGYEDLAQLGLELGLSKAALNRLIRAAKFAKKTKLEKDLSAVDPEVVDAFRRIPDEELPQVLELFNLHPLPVAWQMFHDRWGPERMRTYYIVDAGPSGRLEVRKVRARTEDEVRDRLQPSAVLIRGGVVVQGRVLEEDA